MKSKKQHGRIQLPKGTTANDRAKRDVEFVPNTGRSLPHFVPVANDTRGPLESLNLADHCEMCGLSAIPNREYPFLEAAFNPDSEPMTLCQSCRIGSAELLADQREQMIKVLRGVLHHNESLKPRFKLSPALILHVESVLAKAVSRG